MGHSVDKARKIALAIDKTPGVEDLETEVLINDDGIALTELSSCGVVAAVQPLFHRLVLTWMCPAPSPSRLRPVKGRFRQDISLTADAVCCRRRFK
ncbi:MAG: hypothetical protein ACOX1H_02090 [Pseudoramibacter sp.]